MNGPRTILRRIAAGLFGLAGILLADAAYAQCSVIVTPVAFGTYNVFATAPNDSTGSVTAECGSLLGGTVRISLSRGSSTTFSPRTLRNAARALNYNLYLNAARTTIWGDGSSGTSTYSQSVGLLGGTVRATIYGRIFPMQDVPAAPYSDTIVVTVNF